MNSVVANTRRPCKLPVPLLVSMLIAFCSIAHAAAEEFPAPDWLNREQVSETMIINGIPSLVQHFESYKTIDELLEFYRKQWNNTTSEKPGYREAHVAPWYIISRLDGSYLYTVQVQQYGAFSIRGYLAVADLKAMQRSLKNDPPVPRMSGSKIINDVTSFDPGKKGRTLMLVNKYSVASNSSFYRNHYLERGWKRLLDTDSENAFVMVFRKHTEEAHLVITSTQGSTQIVMNIIEGI